jgi:hypothetical protein
MPEVCDCPVGNGLNSVHLTVRAYQLHAVIVMVFATRLIGLALATAVLAADWQPCAGWTATREARMACCENGGCPMHQSDGAVSKSTHVTQAQADSCCAASERDQAPASPSQFALSMPVAVVSSTIPFVLPVPSLAVLASLILEPLPATPKHLLLSVLLV